MISPPLDSTHGRTKLAMTCHHRPCTARTVGRRQAWHAIIALEKHTRSNDVGRGMTSPPLERTHGRQRRAWHDITALGQYTQSDDVGRCMTSPPLDSTHGRTMLGMTCHHRPCTARTVGQRQAWHAITALEKHTRSNDVGHGMTSPLLENTHSRMTLGVAWHHHSWTTHIVGRRRAWHDITALGQHT